MSGIKLTITIPTYNRPQQIVERIKELTSQMVDGVSIVIYDNCSDIPVSSLLSEYTQFDIRVIRNSVNIGGDANQARCLENVSEGWAWTLGDDDPIRPDAIKTIMGLIDEHPDCCYINLANKKECLINSFDEMLSYFKIRGALGKAFFQSACLYNMNLMRQSVIWFYSFLTSQIGQICMVIKHMELNDGAKCFFSTKPIVTCQTPGGWNPLNLITNSFCIIDKFQYCSSKTKKTLFPALVNIYLDNLGAAKAKPLVKYKYFRLIQKHVGIINLISYNYIAFAYFVMGICLPRSLTRKIHNKVASWYNKRVKN